ncbi:MAG: helix-hairpin-helix domain-containing protein [Bacteroidales bacterium]|nr:helix-hairpin-helix domain-containing protein [Bacteroidales bacterium]
MLRSYFQFTRKERNGILFLFIIIALVWFAYASLDYFFKPNIHDYSQFEKQIDTFYASIEDNPAKIKNTPQDTLAYNRDTCFVDINHPQIEHLRCLGIKEHLAKTWINYTQKGGKFKTIDGLKKLWGMNDSIFNAIAPYLMLNTNDTPTNLKNYSKSNDTPPYLKKAEKKIEMVELNTADTNQLIALPGIGNSFASRIIKYRNRLGGFYNKEQLKEIYGFNQELYEKISPYIYVDVFEIKKVNINTGDYSTLIQNPYFTKEAVKAILQYRKKTGKINNADDLLIHQIVSEDEWNKLKWYVAF